MLSVLWDMAYLHENGLYIKRTAVKYDQGQIHVKPKGDCDRHLFLFNIQMTR